MSKSGDIVINDPEKFSKELRKILDGMGVPHTCDSCGTTDPDDIRLYCCPYLWKCEICGKTFKFKGMTQETLI